MFGGCEDRRLLGLVGYRRVVGALCGIDRLLGVGDVLEELREVGVRIHDVLLLGLGVRLGGIQLRLCGRYGCVGGIKGDLLLLDGRLCRNDCRVGGIEVRFRRIQPSSGIRDALLLGGEIGLCGIDGTLGIGDVLLRGIDTCLCGIHRDLLLLDGCGGAGGCLLLGGEIGLGCIERALGVLETVDIGGKLLLVLVDGHGVHVPTGACPTQACGIEAVSLPAVHGSLAADRHAHIADFRADDMQVVTDGCGISGNLKMLVDIGFNPTMRLVEICGILTD